MEWKDATTYSRDREKIQTAWEISEGELRIVITNAHRFNPGNFTMHCYKLGFDTYDLNVPADQVEEAKQKAIALCKSRVANYLKSLNSIK